MKQIDKAILYGCLTCMFFAFGYWCGHTNEHNNMVENARLERVYDGGYDLTFGDPNRVEMYVDDEYVIE